jgi:hypothetical protein
MASYSDDPTQRADDVAWEMRNYYEANRPLRWWEKRNPPESWGCTADNLMIGLRNIVLDAEEGYRQQQANDASGA